MVRRQSSMVIALAVLLGAAAAVVPIDPPPPSESAPARAAVEMLSVLVAGLAACLILGRARAGGRGVERGDLRHRPGV